ncbi:hypothetical protein KAJ27_02270 [bacterium]|nr:hypothetical protein [bacterium]
MNTIENSEKLIRFIEIKKQIKNLEIELDEIKKDVIDFVQTKDGKIEDDFFSITLNKKVSYTFSDEFIGLQNQVKERRKFEIKNEIAELKSCTIFPMVKFKTVKS